MPALEADKIDETEDQVRQGRIDHAEEDSGAWQMTPPVPAKADEAEVSAITSSLASVEMSRVVDENPANLKDYGLATPRIEVDFKAAGDKDYRSCSSATRRRPAAICSRSATSEKRVFLIPAVAGNDVQQVDRSTCATRRC